MKYKGFHVKITPDSDLLREDKDGNDVRCEGFTIEVFADEYNVPLVKTQMKKIIVTAKTLYSHPKNVSKIYAALHTDLAW